VLRQRLGGQFDGHRYVWAGATSEPPGVDTRGRSLRRLAGLVSRPEEKA
jgi:hypothetical protein